MKLLPLLRGNSVEGGEFTPHDAHGAHERELVRICVRRGRVIVHQSPIREMRQYQAVELLTGQIGDLAAKDDIGATQVALQLVQGSLDLPVVVVRSGQFFGGGLLGVEQAGHQALNFAPTMPHSLPRSCKRARATSIRNRIAQARTALEPLSRNGRQHSPRLFRA